MRLAPKAILLDLDGTLIDSLPPLAMALNDVLDQYQRRRLSQAEVRICMGRGLSTLVQAALELTAVPGAARPDPSEALHRLRARYDVRGVEAVRPVPGIAALLEALSGRARLAVCTNKPRRPTAAVLDRLGWTDRFHAVVALGDAERAKPHPDLVVHALGRLGVSAAEAILVGDTENDAGAARAAGVRFVAVSWGYAKGPVTSLGAQAILDRPEALLDLI